MLTDIYMKFREDSLNGFQVIEQTRFCDGQTYASGKTIGLPTLQGGDIKSVLFGAMLISPDIALQKENPETYMYFFFLSL